jgi:hypothetical protein
MRFVSFLRFPVWFVIIVFLFWAQEGGWKIPRSGRLRSFEVFWRYGTCFGSQRQNTSLQSDNLNGEIAIPKGHS